MLWAENVPAAKAPQVTRPKVKRPKVKRPKESSADVDQAKVLELLDHLRPMRAVGREKIRIGRASDGGYFMLDDFEGVGAAISCGIGKEISWDKAIADRGILVHQFDHTVERSPADHSLFRFHKARSSSGGTTLSEIAQHCGPKAVLKMDIEGDEWPIFSEADPAVLAVFDQIAVEFHGLCRVTDHERQSLYKRALDNLADAFQVIHVHANNNGRFKVVGGVPVPDLLEVTFVRRSGRQFSETDEVFPTPLDHPNIPGKPEFYLGSFKFL